MVIIRRFVFAAFRYRMSMICFLRVKWVVIRQGRRLCGREEEGGKNKERKKGGREERHTQKSQCEQVVGKSQHIMGQIVPAAPIGGWYRRQRGCKKPSLVCPSMRPVATSPSSALCSSPRESEFGDGPSNQAFPIRKVMHAWFHTSPQLQLRATKERKSQRPRTHRLGSSCPT